jgi:hypothetical protein
VPPRGGFFIACFVASGGACATRIRTEFASQKIRSSKWPLQTTRARGYTARL